MNGMTENPDCWERLEKFLEPLECGIDVFGQIIGPRRFFALQSDKQIPIWDARTFVQYCQEGLEIIYEPPVT